MVTKPADGPRSAARPKADEPSTTLKRTRRRSGRRTTGAVAIEPPVKVGSGLAGRRIRGIAELSESIDVRRRLRRLARQIERGPHHVQQMNFIETAIGDCLDDAASASSSGDRWLQCEAATWGLAWMARTKRAGGSAGGILERLVKSARSAEASLASGESLSARFTVTLARLFRDIEACRCLEATATAAVAAEIGWLVSAEGAVSLHGSAAVVDRVNRWASVRQIALATGQAAWDQPTEAAFGKAVAATLGLLGGQARMLVGAGRMPSAFTAALVDAAVDADGKRSRRTAEVVLSARREPRGNQPRRKLLPRDLHDPTAAVAILRSGWNRDAVRVLLEYRDAVPHLEIAVGDRLIVDGPWRWRVSREGRPLDAEGPWAVSGWETDRKATFLEIIAPLAGGLQLDRQVILLPQDRVVLLADAVTRRPGQLQHAEEHARQASAVTGGLCVESFVPLAASLEGDSAEETREILVYDTKPRMMALPLGLPEWKVAGRGAFTTTPTGLSLRQESTGGRCYAPIWLDFDARRQGKPLTWRQLTVADTRQNLPPHQAAGFRIQEGREQWLVYRALDVARNRTLLGCNVSCEFLLGRVGRTGGVDRLIEIQ